MARCVDVLACAVLMSRAHVDTFIHVDAHVSHGIADSRIADARMC
jgi:hypothetical protein